MDDFRRKCMQARDLVHLIKDCMEYVYKNDMSIEESVHLQEAIANKTIDGQNLLENINTKGDAVKKWISAQQADISYIWKNDMLKMNNINMAINDKTKRDK